MTILESLRFKKKNLIRASDEYEEIIQQYDLALENALLKLKNRGVQIKDLQNRLKAIEGSNKSYQQLTGKY